MVERAVRHAVYLGEYQRPADCPVVRPDRPRPVRARDRGGVSRRGAAADRPAGGASAAAQLFHFDLDDFRQLKLFFYLTDVDESAGPHVAVRGTHASKRLGHELMIRRLADDEVARAYGAGSIERFCMPAGGGFEDTYCLHKGQRPTGSERLLLAFNYGINDFYRAGF